jgi:Kef-type K+ transport system membrane component KefB
MESTPTYVPLLLVLALAFAVPVVLLRFRRFGIPIVVGEIAAGMIIGQSGLGLVPPHDPLLSLLAEFGFVFLMFLAGLEVDFSSLHRVDSARSGTRTRSLGPTQLGLVTFTLTLALSTGIGFLLVQSGLAGNPWMVALILSTTSLGVVMPVLKERGLSWGRFGQSILLAALIADFGTMLLITVLVAVVSRGITLDILIIGLLFVAFFLMYQLGLFSNRIPAFRRAIEELSHATAQIKVRAAFTVMLAFVVLSQVLGTEIILGAFLAGAVLSLLRTPDDAQLGHQLEAIGFGFFIPLFFVQVGVRFDLGALAASPSALLLVLVLVLAAVAVKLIPSLLFRTVFSWRETLSAGVTALGAPLAHHRRVRGRPASRPDNRVTELCNHPGRHCHRDPGAAPFQPARPANGCTGSWSDPCLRRERAEPSGRATACRASRTRCPCGSGR